MTGSTNAPAGWYPQADGQQRYWNGESWTQHVAPGVATQPASRSSSKPTQLTGPGSRRFGKAAAFGWGGLALTALLGAVSSGLSGAAIMVGLFALVVGVIAMARGRVGWARLGNRAVAGVVIGVAFALLTIGAVAAPPTAPTSSGLALTSRDATPTRGAATETTKANSAAAEAAAAAERAAAERAAADAAAKASADAAAAATAKAASDAAAKAAREAAAEQAKAVAAASAKAQAAAQARAAAKAKAAAQAKAKAAASAPPPPPAAISYANCTEMHADYKGGVALPGAVDHRSNGGHANYAPVYSRSLYEANSGSDRDGDGIACEA